MEFLNFDNIVCCNLLLISTNLSNNTADKEVDSFILVNLSEFPSLLSTLSFFLLILIHQILLQWIDQII